MSKKDLYIKAGFEWSEVGQHWALEIFSPIGCDWCLIVNDRGNFGADDAEGLAGYKMGSVEKFGTRSIANNLDLLLMYKRFNYIDLNDVTDVCWAGGLLQYNDDLKINDAAKIGALKFWRNSSGAMLCAALVYVGGSQFWARVDIGACIDLYDLATIND